jgi:hypothetical protein
MTFIQASAVRPVGDDGRLVFGPCGLSGELKLPRPGVAVSYSNPGRRSIEALTQI